jgi:hypothetical protein
MGIFREIYELRSIGPGAHVYVKQRLAQAIERGWIEQVPVMKPNRFSPDEEWFRDKETGEIFRLVPGDERGGLWDKVYPEELVGPDEKVN